MASPFFDSALEIQELRVDDSRKLRHRIYEFMYLVYCLGEYHITILRKVLSTRLTVMKNGIRAEQVQEFR